MSKREFDKFLKERFETEINWYDKQSYTNKFWFNALSIYVIAGSIIVPILISYLDVSQLLIKIIIAVTSGSVAIAASINNLFKFQENWINYRTTCETLRKEKSYYLGNVDDYSRAKDKEALFIERVEAIISRENTLWLTVQKIEKNKTSS